MQAASLEVRSPDGTAIPVWRSGEGVPLVLVHGSGDDHRVWDRLVERLQARTVLTLDRRTTFTDPSVPLDLEREFEDIVAVAATAGDSVDLVGASSGAVVALGAGLRMSNLRRLVLYEPPLLSQSGALLEKLESLLASGDNEAVEEVFLREAVKLNTETIEAIKLSRAWPAFVSRAAYTVREYAMLSAWQPDERLLKCLEAPTLLLLGQKTPLGHHHRGYEPLLRSALGRLKVREIPGEEHAAHRASPELFAHMVLEFLEEA